MQLYPWFSVSEVPLNVVAAEKPNSNVQQTNNHQETEPIKADDTTQKRGLLSKLFGKK